MEGANVISRAYTIKLFNEMSEAWIKTTSEGKVFMGSENVLPHVLNLSIEDAMQVLSYRGWEVESWIA